MHRFPNLAQRSHFFLRPIKNYFFEISNINALKKYYEKKFGNLGSNVIIFLFERNTIVIELIKIRDEHFIKLFNRFSDIF